MAKKKYRIVVGMCGPTPLQTNIIKAEDERDAVIQYLESCGKEVTEDSIRMYLDHTYESIPTPKRKENESIVDVLGNVLSVDSNVAFIRNERNTPPKLLTGRITRISNSSVVITDGDGNEYRISCTKDTFRMDKAVIMRERPQREGDHKDATGYPICIGDKVVYMEDPYASASRKLIPGTVKELKKTRAIIGAPEGDKSWQMSKTYIKIFVL